MEPEIVSRPAFTVVGVKYRGQNKQSEIPALWHRFAPTISRVPRRVNPHEAFGVTGNHDPRTGDFDYVAGVAVETPPEIPEGMVAWDVPTQTYSEHGPTAPCPRRGQSSTTTSR